MTSYDIMPHLLHMYDDKLDWTISCIKHYSKNLYTICPCYVKHHVQPIFYTCMYM